MPGPFRPGFGLLQNRSEPAEFGGFLGGGLMDVSPQKKPHLESKSGSVLQGRASCLSAETAMYLCGSSYACCGADFQRSETEPLSAV